MQIELFYLAHSRTGDKGNSQTMSLIPYDESDYALLELQVTTGAVVRQFGKLVRGKVTRYALPKLKAFNFVLEEALQGGVNDSLNLDTHGNCLENPAVIHPWHAARLVRQHRLDGSPLLVGEFVAHDSASWIRV